MLKVFKKLVDITFGLILFSIFGPFVIALLLHLTIIIGNVFASLINLGTF